MFTVDTSKALRCTHSSASKLITYFKYAEIFQKKNLDKGKIKIYLNP